MQFQLNENVSGFYICPCPFRRYPPLWGRLGIVEDNGFKVAAEPATNNKTPTALSWGFLLLACANSRVFAGTPAETCGLRQNANPLGFRRFPLSPRRFSPQVRSRK